MTITRETITIKLTPGKDDDLIAWWESLPLGDYQTPGRQRVIKQALRRALDMPATVEPSSPQPLTVDLSELYALIAQQRQQLDNQNAWIQKIAEDLPGYVQGEISKALATGAPLPPPPTVEGGAQLDASAVEKRAKRLKDSQW